jgi:ribosomal-protein-alanine N-acetyltransferase
VIFNLRTYKPQDFEKLYEIDQVCYEREIAYSRRELRNYLRFPGAACVVLEIKEKRARKIVGFCVTAHKGTEGYIVTIDVLEPYRRHGAGAALLAKVEQQLAASGVREVGLETATDNASAIAFWKKHGYRTRGIQKAYYPNGVDALSMSKALEGD